jgi:hypothetical protein
MSVFIAIRMSLSAVDLAVHEVLVLVRHMVQQHDNGTDSALTRRDMMQKIRYALAILDQVSR